jgi:hypothetical protein
MLEKLEPSEVMEAHKGIMNIAGEASVWKQTSVIPAFAGIKE